MPPDDVRIKRLEDKVASLEVATSHGFGEMKTDLRHLGDLVKATIDKPSPPPPVWVLLLSSGTFLVGAASLVVAIAQFTR